MRRLSPCGDEYLPSERTVWNRLRGKWTRPKSNVCVDWSRENCTFRTRQTFWWIAHLSVIIPGFSYTNDASPSIISLLVMAVFCSQVRSYHRDAVITQFDGERNYASPRKTNKRITYFNFPSRARDPQAPQLYRTQIVRLLLSVFQEFMLGSLSKNLGI